MSTVRRVESIASFVALAIAASGLGPGQALAVDPWVSDSLEIGDQDYLKAFREVLEARKAIWERRRALSLVGYKGGTTQDVWLSAGDYFRTDARIAWLEGDIERSFRSTEFALFATEIETAARQNTVEAGVVSREEVGLLEQALLRQGRLKTILLRYRDEAGRRDLKLSPSNVRQMHNAIESIFALAADVKRKTTAFQAPRVQYEN